MRDTPRPCWKRRYATEYEAQRALDRIIARPTAGHHPSRVEDCWRCEGWHLTTLDRPAPSLRRTQTGPARPRLTGPTDEVRAVVLERDGYACVRCGVSVLGTRHYPHHRIPRGAGGTHRPEVNTAAALLTLCGSGTTGCHGWTESHRFAAGVLGLLLPRNARPPVQPDEHPVRMRGIGWVLLDDHGGRHPVAAPHTAA